MQVKQKLGERILCSFAQFNPANYTAAFVVVAGLLNLATLFVSENFVFMFLVRQNLIVLESILVFLLLWLVKLTSHILLRFTARF